MPVVKSKPPLSGTPPWLEKVIKTTSREILSQRFPRVTGRGEITVDDLDGAVSAVAEQLAPLLADRDRNRAHRYQHESIGDTQSLETRDVRWAVEVVQELLKDVRYLVEASTFEYPDDIFGAPIDGTAEELVDQVLLGTRVQRDLLEERLLLGSADRHYGWQRRERVYEILHRRHDALADPAAECFNADSAVIGRDE